MSDLPEPRWHLLPNRPEEFFGLGQEFDRKELKRRYNALLRKYKPEKFPAEFQKLRAAFESLDTRLRYGEQVTRPAAFTYQWTENEATPATAGSAASPTPKPANRSPASATPPPVKRAPSILERLEQESPAAVYQSLDKKPNKTPYEFYALAVLADVVHPNDRLLFCRWLLTGLKVHPGDPALWRLLYSYFHAIVDETEIPKILPAISKVIGDDRFYFLTEILWDRLLASWSFDKFLGMLQRCEANLSDHRVQGKVVFYLHILRPAIWKAPASWLEQTFAFLDQNSEFIGGDLEYDLELTSRLYQYHQQRQSFLDGNPAREQIDRAIEKFCGRDELEGQRAVVDCQLKLSGDAEGILQAFPVSLEPKPLELSAWLWICEEIAQQLGLPATDREPSKLAEALYVTMVEIDNQEPNTPWMVCVLMQRFGHALASLLCVAWPFLLLSAIFPATETFIYVYLAIGIATVFLYWVWLRKLTVTKLVEHYRVKVGTRRYRTDWRRRILRFFSANHVNYFQVSEIAFQVTSRRQDLTSSTWLPYFIRCDYGLLIYSLALRFLR